MMTTWTTVLALVPMAIGIGTGEQIAAAAGDHASSAA